MTTTKLPNSVAETGKKCPNNKYLWHRIDGYCKECSKHQETNEAIQARRNAKGYR